MTDGLYLNNQWVAEVQVVLSFQANDLTKPATLQSSYSNEFTLPDTLAIRSLFENAEQIDAGGRHPYELLKARLVEAGEVIFSGVARLVSFQAGWSVTLFSAQKGLYELLETKKLQDLDLARYDHPWNTDSMSALAGKAEGVTYGAIDYGNFDGAQFDASNLFPSVYVHTIVGQMLYEAGYKAVGDWLNDPLYEAMALPFVEDEAKAREPEWVTDRTSLVTVAGETSYSMGLLRRPIDILLPFTVDNKPPLYVDGKKDNFKPALKAYVCDTAMRVRVQGSQPFKAKIGYGAVEALLIVEKNGVNVAQAYFSVSGPYNITNTKTETLKVNELIECRSGDQLRLRFILRERTKISDTLGSFTVKPELTWASFTPDAAIRRGDMWLTAKGLPEMNCHELLKAIALMQCGTIQVDDYRRTVSIVRLDDIVSNTANAVDWSSRVEESQEPELTVALTPYGQSNYLRWKEFDFRIELPDNKLQPISKPNTTPRALQFGDGTIVSPASNLPIYADLFEMPFAACQPSSKLLAGYGNPVLIRTVRVIKKGTNVEVEREATTPRIILIEPGKTVDVQVKTLTPELTIRVVDVRLTACWWGPRPAGAETNDNAFSLAFTPVNPYQPEQTQDKRYFTGLTRVLRRPRLLSLPVYLTPADVSELPDTLKLPIRIQRVRAGAMDLNDGFYYLNKVSDHTTGRPCRATVIPYY